MVSLEIDTSNHTSPTEEESRKFRINRTQWFQLVGESIVFAGSTFFLIDALNPLNMTYMAGSMCCQFGSLLMIAQSVLVITSPYCSTCRTSTL